MSDEELTDMCAGYTVHPPNAGELLSVIKPSVQIIHDGKLIGFMDIDGNFKVCRPTEPISGLQQIIL